MDIRHLQRMGGASFSLILPKKWVTEQRLGHKYKVYLSPRSSGALVVLPRDPAVQARHKISIQGWDKDSVYRQIIVLYILGLNEIELVEDTITKDRRQLVRD